ncbi:potassium voltage-gated channel subfamily H member 8 [Lates japonicus]|uniref:Potassium voltage-gated channel subfamily H member 8 n=1 Tax=Lates japonicus TaxID=270547 RepID=A0AAD3MNJ9_LATJO|nr:potassium voltage-gated channel subfamily H member 8 [Lates japonicus]
MEEKRDLIKEEEGEGVGESREKVEGRWLVCMMRCKYSLLLPVILYQGTVMLMFETKIKWTGSIGGLVKKLPSIREDEEGDEAGSVSARSPLRLSGGSNPSLSSCRPGHSALPSEHSAPPADAGGPAGQRHLNSAQKFEFGSAHATCSTTLPIPRGPRKHSRIKQDVSKLTEESPGQNQRTRKLDLLSPEMVILRSPVPRPLQLPPVMEYFASLQDPASWPLHPSPSLSFSMSLSSSILFPCQIYRPGRQLCPAEPALPRLLPVPLLPVLPQLPIAHPPLRPPAEPSLRPLVFPTVSETRPPSLHPSGLEMQGGTTGGEGGLEHISFIDEEAKRYERS